MAENYRATNQDIKDLLFLAHQGGYQQGVPAGIAKHLPHFYDRFAPGLVALRDPTLADSLRVLAGMSLVSMLFDWREDGVPEIRHHKMDSDVQEIWELLDAPIKRLIYLAVKNKVDTTPLREVHKTQDFAELAAAQSPLLELLAIECGPLVGSDAEIAVDVRNAVIPCIERMKPSTANAQAPERLSHFTTSTDPKVTTCEAWKSLMQFRHELLTNPRQDKGGNGWWSAWVGTMQRWLSGGGDWGGGYYAPSHRVTTPDCAISLADVLERQHATFTPDTAHVRSADDDERTMFFPADATYLHPGFVIDWAKPFPPIADRGPLVEWVESWIDRITYTEATGHFPWEPFRDDGRRVTLPAESLEPTCKPTPPASDSAILTRLDAVLTGLPAMMEGHRAGIDRVAGVIESLAAQDKQDAPAARLPVLQPHDRQAWQLATLHGMTQAKVATMLNKEHGTCYAQGQVSRMIRRVQSHAVQSGLAEKIAAPIDRPRTVDPGRLEIGARVDKRKPRPSDMARANDDDE